jgi:DNA gyrase subunit A
MSTFSFSRAQAVNILEMKLSRLTGLERDKILNELAELMKSIAWYNQILSDEITLFGVIKDELKDVLERYGDERLTNIVEYDGELNYEDLIADDDMIVTLTTENYIKRTSLDLYRKQKRGGKGINAINPKENDFVKDIFMTSAHTQLLIFTNYGKVYWTKVYQLPEAGRNSRGKPIVNLIQVEKDEKVAAILPIKQFNENSFLMFATANGVVKKTDIMEFARPRSTGKIAIKLRDGDRLIGVQISNGDNEVVLATKLGLSIRFHENDIRSMGRTAAGVRGVRLSAGNEVMTMDLIEEGKTLLAITDKGMGKRTDMDEYRKQSRGGKGVITIKTSEENGYVVGLLKVDEADEAMLITSNGQAIRIPVNGIRVIGRNTKGVRLFRLAKDEHVVAITRIMDPEKVEETLENQIDNSTETPPEGSESPSSETPSE